MGEEGMKRLVLTGWLIPDFTKSDFADLAVYFFFRFVWGALPSPHELETYFGPRMPDQGPGSHWSDFSGGWGQSKNKSNKDLGLAEFCPQYETVELRGAECSIATGLAARLFSILSGDRG
jgi:hypothetical protein